MGQLEPSLAATKEAVLIYRDLTRINPTICADLARTLGLDLHSRYRQLNLPQEALTASQEAYQIFLDYRTAPTPIDP